MNIPTTAAEIEFDVKRSRFIGIAIPISTDSQAKQLIRETRQQHPDASHVVHAYILGRRGDTFSMSDDKEPRNTAGRPVLEVLKGSGITNIMVMVVRYFGGTKLGTGGLVHAYSQAAKEVLREVPTEELIDKSSFSIEIGYDAYEQVKKELLSHQAVLTDELFETVITLTGTLPDAEFASAVRKITDLTSGKAHLNRLTAPSS